MKTQVSSENQILEYVTKFIGPHWTHQIIHLNITFLYAYYIDSVTLINIERYYIEIKIILVSDTLVGLSLIKFILDDYLIILQCLFFMKKLFLIKIIILVINASIISIYSE